VDGSMDKLSQGRCNSWPSCPVVHVALICIVQYVGLHCTMRRVNCSCFLILSRARVCGRLGRFWSPYKTGKVLHV